MRLGPCETGNFADVFHEKKFRLISADALLISGIKIPVSELIIVFNLYWHLPGHLSIDA